jgi:hypothetical protein
MIQDSSRARRLEVEDSMISVRESVAYNSCGLARSLAAICSALFVRDVATNHISHSSRGGPATNNVTVSIEADPVHVGCPAWEIFAVNAPFPKLTATLPCEFGS